MKKQFDQQNTVYLIDGSTFLYRAYYSMRPLHTSKGLPVQAVYNFCRMIKKLIDTFDPHKIVLVWDSKTGGNPRREIFSEYKAGRQSPPSDLFQQKELIVQFANLIGLKQIEVAGAEADDIINSLTQDFKENHNIVIIASDKDLYQLLSTSVFIFDAFKDELVDQETFEKKIGFAVNKIPFFYALIGDASDNIPGVKGIGKVTATEIVNEFNDLENLYANLEKIKKEKIKNALIENRDNAFLSYKLFLLRYFKTNITIDDMAFNPKDWINSKSLFEELEFKSLLKDIEKVHSQKIEEKPFFGQEKNYTFKCIQNKNELKNFIKYLNSKKIFAFDTETNGLNPYKNQCVGFSLCAEKGLAFYIPFGHQINEEQLTKEEVLENLKPILEDKNFKKILHNANFDQLVLYNLGVNLVGIDFDTLLAANLIVQDWQRIGLKYLSEFYLNERMLTFEDIVKDRKLKDFSFVNLSAATNYAAADAHQTFVLKDIFENKISEMNLSKLYYEIDFPLSDVLFKMEISGIKIDVEILKKISIKLDHELNILIKEIQLFIGDESINLNSPKQIEDLLFNKLKLPPQKKSGKGKGFSTDQKVLEELSNLHPVPKLLLKYRELFKLKSTYVDALPDYINPKTGKIHSTFSQVTTSTGRLSSFDPNLQNIPIDGYGIRNAFIPDENYLFLSADYSQIELRILAYFSQDKNLINSFSKNEDIHSKTAAYLFNVPVEKVTNEYRQIGKRINFSILYGLTPFGLSKDLKIPLKDAKFYIEKYFEQYPQVKQWMNQIVEFAKEKGYVETFFGRRRYISGIHEKNKMLYEFAKRAAINMPAQGTAADIMKIGMINLTNFFEERKIDAKILLQIHDELLIQIPKNNAAQIEDYTKTILESVVNWNIPLLVTTRFGNNWQEVTK